MTDREIHEEIPMGHEKKSSAPHPLARVLIITALAICVTSLLPNAPVAQETAASHVDADLQKAKSDLAQAKKELAKADADLRKTDSLIADEAARASQSVDRASKDHERREKENAALQTRIQEAQAKIAAERGQQSRRQNTVEEIKVRQKNLSLTLAGFCDSLARRIGEGLPWDNEARLDRVKALRKDLESGAATVDEGFARLNAVLKEEIKNGDEIALINKPVTRKNGEVVNAQLLKVGNQWLVYMDEEGQHFGILERKPGVTGTPGTAASASASASATTSTSMTGWDWREDPSFAEKNQIRAALEIKAAKRPPQLATLNLGIAPKGGK